MRFRNFIPGCIKILGQTSLENRAFDSGKSTPIAKAVNKPPIIAETTVSHPKVAVIIKTSI